MKEERVMVDRRGNQWKKFVGYGLTAFLVLAAGILLVFVFVRHEDFSKYTGKISKALTPVVVGGVFAYLMNPIMCFFETKLRSLFYRHAKRIKRANSLARGISILLTVVFVILLIGFLMYLLIPQLVTTITGIINDMPQQVDKVTAWYYSLELEETVAGEYIEMAFVKITEYVQDFVENKMVSTATNVIGSIATGVWSFIGTIYNILIGFIFAIYMLSCKEKLAAISKKITYAIFKRKRANSIVRITRACHSKFIGSITGKVVDSAIIGLLCFVAMTIIDIPYPPLISVMIGVTNVIPFFGPFIGAIPSALLILFADPMKCLYFLIMVFILQQIDGNILTPKIVGDSIGLSPFWVLFACTVFGSLWGVVGMLVGVPLMACIYMIVKEIVEDRLHNKGLMIETDDYQDLDQVDETEMFCKVVDTEAEAAKKYSEQNYNSVRVSDLPSGKVVEGSTQTEAAQSSVNPENVEPEGIQLQEEYIPASAKELNRAAKNRNNFVVINDTNEIKTGEDANEAANTANDARKKLFDQLKGLFHK